MRRPREWGNTEDHKAYMRDWAHAWYWRLVLEGRCVRCEMPKVNPILRTCGACREKERARDTRRRYRSAVISGAQTATTARVG